MNANGKDLSYPLGTSEIRTLALVTNPHVGRDALQIASTRASQVFADRGIDVIALQGANPSDARKLIREVIADGRIDALAVCSGDDMINLALQGQTQIGILLDIIPAGIGNNYDREYNLPRGNARDTAHVIADGFWTTTDLSRITDEVGGQRWFDTIMCADFDSIVSDHVNQTTWPHGRNRYNLAIVREFLVFHSLPFRITLDDDRVLEDPIMLTVFGDIRSYGGGMKIRPSADHSDGLMDITVIGRAEQIKTALAFKSVFDGTVEKIGRVSAYRAKKAYVEYISSPRQMNAYADGDLMFPTPVTVEIVPGAGRYIVPRL